MYVYQRVPSFLNPMSVRGFPSWPCNWLPCWLHPRFTKVVPTSYFKLRKKNTSWSSSIIISYIYIYIYILLQSNVAIGNDHYSWFTYSKWWSSIAMLICQRVNHRLSAEMPSQAPQRDPCNLWWSCSSGTTGISWGYGSSHWGTNGCTKWVDFLMYVYIYIAKIAKW